MRRFELHVADLETADKVIVAEGVLFTDGTVVLCDMTTRGRGYTVYPDGIGSLAPLFEVEEITWLDKGPILAVVPEQSPARHTAEAVQDAEAIEHLEDTVWNGDPLPHG